jgi:single-strand DNA-binding protein
MINKVILIGNLGKDPEVRHLENGGSVARLTIATNESYRDKEGNWQSSTEWHNVIAWRNLADNAEKNLKKGSMVFIEGKLKTRQYKDAAGVEKYTTEIEAVTLRGLDRNPSQNGSRDIPMPDSSNEVRNNYSVPASVQKSKADDFISTGEDDDLPF